MIANDIEKAIQKLAAYYDAKKVGDTGPLGFRRTSDLSKVSACLIELIGRDILVPGKSLFMDMGCGDGRVNVLFSYLVKRSIGIELDEWTLDDYGPLKKEIVSELVKYRLPVPPDNISLFRGDTMDSEMHETMLRNTGVSFKDFDIFYTYLTMHEEFAGLISREGKEGAIFIIYGLDRIMPDLYGFERLTLDGPIQNILGIYKKITPP